MSSPSQSNYAERLAEKLKHQAKKRGADSPVAEELERIKGVVPQKRERVEEKKKSQE